MLILQDLAVNAVKAPRFVPCDGLELSWKLVSDRQGVLQKDYRIVITAADGSVIYDTEVVDASRSVHVPLDITLDSRADYLLDLLVTDNTGDTAESTLALSTAIDPEEWEAQWIKPRRHIEGWAPYLRTKFVCRPDIRRAKLYVCGLGCGEYTINGMPVSHDLIDPPISNYEREVYYRIYDVTSLLGEQNTFVALLGEGWYSQSRVWGSHGMKYGDVCLLCRLEIEYADGEMQVITSGTEDWTYKYSPITSNNLYAGETYDCRLETPDVHDYNGDDSDWGSVVEDTTPRGTLRLCEMPAVRVTRTLPAVSVKQASGRNDGAWIIDFGENVAGVVELHTRNSPRGAQYILRYAETINEDGTLDHRSTGGFATQCIQQDIYIARGDAEGETWSPRFTYHGFRYVEITGYHDLRAYGTDPELSVAVCRVVNTALDATGTFESTHRDLDRLHRIMTTTFLSNYHGIPEDCPAREKCGWLGDAEVVSDTCIYNLDVEASYRKYLRDMKSSDDVYGVWQMIAPGKRGCGEATPLWGCANVIIPHRMYRYYGCESVIHENWHMMEKWMAHEIMDARKNVEETGSAYIITRGLGDWCPPVGNRSPRRIPVPESSTAMFYETATIMATLAAELELPTSVDYAALAASIKEAFNELYWIPELHRYSTWGTCGVALQIGLCPDGEEEHLLNALLALMAEDDYAMPTGIYGNKYLVPALAERGHGDLALKFLLSRDHASFGTMLDDGATSLWECLEMRGIGQPREKDCASYNHPMHAGFAYFYHAHVGGIRPLKPGFAEFEIKPCYFADIPAATVCHISPYGEIVVAFERKGGKTTYSVTVPANTVAHFRAGGMDETVGSGTHIFVTREGGAPLPCKKLHPAATLPVYATGGSAGADLCALADGDPITVRPGETVFVRTGLAMAVPDGYVGLICARSGMACKRGLAPANKVGVIDSDYRGEVMVALYNHGSSPQTVQPGDRIAQLLLLPVPIAAIAEVDDLDATTRGAGGFGSTGTR